MSAMTLFENKNLDLSVLEGFEDSLSNNITGGSTGPVSRKIGIKAGTFRQIVNGKEVENIEDRFLNTVIVSAAPVHKIFYADKYEEGKIIRPTCWSSNTQTPDADVPEDQKQSDRCMDCPQHVKGSGGGESRACKSRQKIAVLLDGEIQKKEVYEIDLPGQSVFGDGTKNKMPLHAYGRHLKAHNTPVVAVVTEIRFDTESSSPKLVFKAVRPLEQAELVAAVEASKSEEAKKATALSIAPAKKEDATTATKKLAAPTKEDDEEVEEPKKVAKKATAEVKPKSDLDDIVGEWDD